jgi:phosphotriesterase-related protein
MAAGPACELVDKTPAEGDEVMAAGMAQTVLGPVPPAELGLTLPHEHLFLHIEGWSFPPRDEDEARLAVAPVSMDILPWLHRRALSNRDNCLIDDFDTVRGEVQDYRAAGGQTIVDLTVPEIGRSVELLQRVSLQTGVTLIAGCGHYVDAAHPPELKNMSAEAIAQVLESELTDGIRDTGIRPGVIGEVGTGNPITHDERKVLRAAAIAHARTGAPISIHLFPAGGTAAEVLDLLEEAGVPASAVVMGHLDGQDPIDTDLHLQLAARGAYIEYDMFGANWSNDDSREMHQPHGYWSPPPSDQQRVRAVREMFAAGFGDRVLISHDVCTKIQQAAWGGSGFAHIPRYMRPFFLANGFTDSEFRQVVADNPQRWLTWAAPKPLA